MWKTHPTVTPQKVASRTLSSTKETILRSQASKLLILTLWSKQAFAPPQAYLRLRTNQSCKAAWNIFSSFYPDSSPRILLLGRGTKLRVKETMSCTWGLWYLAANMVIIWSQGWSRGNVLLLSLLPVNSSQNVLVSLSTLQRATSSPRPCRKSSLVIVLILT